MRHGHAGARRRTFPLPLFLIFCLTVFVQSPPAQAQNWDALESVFDDLTDYFSELSEFDEKDWRVRLGGAAGRVPDFSGSSHNETRVLPLFQIRYKDDVWLDPLGLRVKVWDWDCCRLLAQAGVAPGRNPDPWSPVSLLPNVSSGLDLGTTFEGRVAEYVAFRIRARKEVAGGHGGVGLSATIGTAIPVGDFSLVPELAVEWKNDTYMDKFYGVDPAFTAVTGFDPFDPDAGLEDLTLRLTAVYDVTENWRVLVRGQGGFLLSDARKSSIVRQGGDDFQGQFGVGVLYEF